MAEVKTLPKVHKLQEDERIDVIATNRGITVADLLKANEVNFVGELKPGMTLKFPE